MTTREDEIQGRVTWGRLTRPLAQNTENCSFCGRSRDEVAGMVATSHASICDQCAETAEERLWESQEDRILIKVKVPQNSEIDDIFLRSIGEVLAERFPLADVRYENRERKREPLNASAGGMAVFSIKQIYGVKGKDVGRAKMRELERKYSELEGEIRDTVAKLSVVSEKYRMQSKRFENVKNELVELKGEMFDYLRKDARSDEAAIEDLRCVMFLDVSGFSMMEESERSGIIGCLRGLVPLLVAPSGATDINMWGDAIVANFEDANETLRVAVKFLRHLQVEKVNARIAIAWGPIVRRYNPAVQRFDIEGEVVNFAARMEPLAEIGTILVSKEFAGLEISASEFRLDPVTIALKKGVGVRERGDGIAAFRVTPLSN